MGYAQTAHLLQLLLFAPQAFYMMPVMQTAIIVGCGEKKTIKNNPE